MAVGSFKRGDISAIKISVYKFSISGIIHLKTIVNFLTALLLFQESDCHMPMFKLSLLPKF